PLHSLKWEAGDSRTLFIHVVEGATLVSRDVIGLVAFDLILGIVLAGAVRVPLVVEVFRMHLDNRSRDPAGLRIPADMVTNFEPFTGHFPRLLFEGSAISTRSGLPAVHFRQETRP